MATTLARAAHSEIIIKKSRFIGCVQPVSGRAQAQEVVAALWRAHPQARHVCWALMAGGQSAANDDGEPSGTAGRPMLEVLRHHQLDGVLATVVRYFGGIKLGAGGLVRAYTDAVAQALAGAEKVLLQRQWQWLLRADYAHENTIRHVAAQHGATIVSVDYGQQVMLRISVLEAQAQPLRQAIDNATQGGVHWQEGHALA
ncbi:IMPACT protein [Lampropedia cohaerens]|uniref:IMPACT protein n=1 Tax=Lampropedia cohaerens TaxID=1610491 RepID=A0A0U1Q3L7_9BURK|nr:YigZ family protein [Lampropedia cohaerens]KKW69368.1 IMPACT protein [Lampropedia cohaerens]